MNADLHNLDNHEYDHEPSHWEHPWNDGYESSYDDGRGDPDETALEMADAELDQIDRWIDVAEQHDPN